MTTPTHPRAAGEAAHKMNRYERAASDASKDGLELYRNITGALSSRGALTERTSYSVRRLSDGKLLCQNQDTPKRALERARAALALAKGGAK